MAQSIQPGRFGHSAKPDDAWLAKQEKEPILEPELPIVDAHHHLWDRGGCTYLLSELLADLNTGHNVDATVFEECRSIYRATGTVEMRPPNSTAWAQAWRPYVEPCIELFGAERCTFESNFPVDKMGSDYPTLWNAFKRITDGCSQPEKLALYSGTAQRLYHLDT
jgi:predicted TIM-barrel fold metal-dependent hydrolase